MIRAAEPRWRWLILLSSAAPYFGVRAKLCVILQSSLYPPKIILQLFGSQKHVPTHCSPTASRGPKRLFRHDLSLVRTGWLEEAEGVLPGLRVEPEGWRPLLCLLWRGRDGASAQVGGR
jgi:hypothetical protein